MRLFPYACASARRSEFARETTNPHKKTSTHGHTTFLVGHGTFPKEMAYYEHSNGESVSSCLSESPTIHVELCQKPTRYQMKLPPTKRAIIVCLPLQYSATISAEGEGSGCSGETWLHVW